MKHHTMNECAQKPNIFRGIAVYADPIEEMRKRTTVQAGLERIRPEQRPEAIKQLSDFFGRETVRAVVGEDGA